MPFAIKSPIKPAAGTQIVICVSKDCDGINVASQIASRIRIVLLKARPRDVVFWQILLFSASIIVLMIWRRREIL
jgi:hypothetical protein